MEHAKLNYIELPASHLTETKRFFSEVFDWQFIDYGPEYTAFTNSGLDGGFYQSDLNSETGSGGALLVFYSKDLKSTYKKVQQYGGQICKEVFDFPGGCRFHFKEPSGNELAVWSETF